MSWVDWVVMILAAVEAFWMLFDGSRALVVGDFVTPRSGPYAGQLGPWTHLVRAVGIEPRSTLMKSVFVAYGTAWLAVLVCLVAFPGAWTWWAMVAAAAGALWFLPVGTLFSTIQLVLLIWFSQM